MGWGAGSGGGGVEGGEYGLVGSVSGGEEEDAEGVGNGHLWDGLLLKEGIFAIGSRIYMRATVPFFSLLLLGVSCWI